FVDLFPFPKQRYQISKCDTCNPSPLPTFHACLDPPVKPSERPTPFSSESSSTKRPPNAISKPHIQRKPQTSQDCDNSAWWQPRASLLMVAPKISRPIIRGGIGCDLIHHTRLLSRRIPSASPPTGGSPWGSAQILMRHGHQRRPCTPATRNCARAPGPITPAAANNPKAARAVSTSPRRIRPRTYAGRGTWGCETSSKGARDIV
ncbi:hypothetical protein JB92DRAFT_3033546, partial [Gautieria morchelliformis]